MTRLCIVGGALQGMEATFLASKAGFETVVIDRREEAPALSLCDEPVVMDPVVDPDSAADIISGCDAVLPACEEMDLLESLSSICGSTGTPLLFDLDSYRISSSKLESNRIMECVGAPLPKPWPECGFPVIVKPSGMSGSVGVSVANDETELAAGLEKVHDLGDDAVVQEFVHGKSVSIEVIGNGADARAYVTTEVVLDYNYDCKMVLCTPDILTREDDIRFAEVGEMVAKAIGLRALMDVEAILTADGLRVLEIDARIPSQTPATIWAATGINLLQELVEISLGREIQRSPRQHSGHSSAYFHLVYSHGALSTCGEKEFSHVVRPHMTEGLFGTDEAITDYEPGKSEWRGTFIIRGESRDDVLSRFDETVFKIMEVCDATRFVNRSPEVI